MNNNIIENKNIYNLNISEKLAGKIALYCSLNPHTEWSGVLFYRQTGSVEKDNLILHAEDMVVLDVGTGGYTKFDMSPDVVSYMVDNQEVADCCTGLIHSHNQIASYFSGTDMSTLETEGSERANFLSLIVNNKMECVAKYTRKIIRDYKITYTDSFWKEDKFVKGDKKKNESKKTYVETWNLACMFPNQEDIDAIKKLQEKKIVPNTGFAQTKQLSLFDDWDTFYEKKRAESEGKLHSETIKTVKPETTEKDDIYEDVIKDYAIRLITGDVYSTETDIDSCIERMQKKYDTDKEFRENVEGNVEWLCQYIISDMMEDELEFFIDYLSEHAKNSSYMQRIMEGIKIWN